MKSLNEKLINIKRKYTESHPAINKSNAASIRNMILDSIGETGLSKIDLDVILKELGAHPKWIESNASLFDISEDAGTVYYNLSKEGNTIKKKTRGLIEALDVPYTKHGDELVNFFVGRFQPFTLGHVKVFEQLYKENGKPVVILIVKGKTTSKDKNPFDEDIQQAMFAALQKEFKFLKASFIVANGAIDTVFKVLRPSYEPLLWGYGTDRKNAYENMINKSAYREALNVHPNFSGFEIKRADEDISASAVREALRLDNYESYKKLVPNSMYSFYDSLKNIVNVNESRLITDFNTFLNLNEN